MGKKLKPCPLKANEWVQYLTFEQNRERYDYYNGEMSILTRVIILLTIQSIVVSLVYISFSFFEVNNEYKLGFFLGYISIFICFIALLISYLSKLRALREDMYEVMDKEARIIEDVLNGEVKDSNKIRDRYMAIWNKLK